MIPAPDDAAPAPAPLFCQPCLPCNALPKLAMPGSPWEGSRVIPMNTELLQGCSLAPAFLKPLSHGWNGRLEPIESEPAPAPFLRGKGAVQCDHQVKSIGRGVQMQVFGS